MEVENGGNEATVTYGEKLYTYIYQRIVSSSTPLAQYPMSVRNDIEAVIFIIYTLKVFLSTTNKLQRHYVVI